EETSSVPWIPAPLKKPIHRALIGSSGPGGITCPARLPAHGESGTCQEGLTCLSSIVYWPAGVSSPACPTAIVYVLTSFRFFQSRSWNAPRSMVKKTGYLWASSSVVTWGFTRFTGGETTRWRGL